MALTSLVVCPDTRSVQVLTRVLQDLGIRVEHCSDLSAAASLVAVRQFDAVLVDCRNEKDAIEFITTARQTSINRTTLAIAMVDAENSVREIFAKGANFVLYKPITSERAGSSLRAARGLMRREKRRNRRIRVHSKASIAYANKDNAPATLLDLSDDGIGIQSEFKLPPRCKVYFEFTLPGQVSVVRLSGEVMWQDSAGRVGMRFVDVPQASRKVLSGWLRTNLAQAEAEPILLDVPAVGSQDAKQPGGLGLLASSSDRRVKSRVPCRLGADVYRMGTGVPNRCILSDIGTGGCYVETTSPFPPGAPVEIIVRTQDFKLRVLGTVQTTHPGFGMGVEFTLRTADQRAQVEQLIACQNSEGISV